MSNKKLIILGIITAAMIAWSIVQAHIADKKSVTPDTPVYLIQGLDTELINSVVIKSDGENLTLKRMGDGFGIVEKDNYPALIDEVNNLISTCLDIKTSGLYTDNPDNHRDLKVTEEEADYVIRFLKPDTSLIAGMIVGKSKEQGKGTFVRLISDNKVYVTYNDIRLKDQATEYFDNKLFSVESGDVEFVTVTQSGATYSIKKDEEGNVAIDNLPAGKNLIVSKAEDVLNALNNLSFTDVKKKAPETWIDFDSKYVCALKDSTVYTIMLGKKDDKVYLTCEAKFTDTTPVVKDDGVESEEELKKKEAKLVANDNANEFTTKHSNWIYEITRYNSSDLIIKHSELLEDIEVESEEEPTDN